MRKKVLCVMLAAASLALTVPAFAAPSIGQIIPEAPKVESGSLAEGETLVVQDVNTDAYQNKTVASVITKANDENTKTTVTEILTELNVDTKTTAQTNTGKKVNPTLYEQLTPFVDIAIQDSNSNVTYQSNGSITVSTTFEAAKGMDKKNVMIMQVNPDTGKVTFVQVEKLDKTTGEVTATFDSLGPISLLEKVPIVVKDTSPENYSSPVTANVITEFKQETKDISLTDVLKSVGAGFDSAEITTKDGKAITVDNPVVTTDDGQEIDLSKYSSAMGFADLAIKMDNDYSYDMGGELTADANRDISNVDWQRIVTDSSVSVDLTAAETDPSVLAELDPFTVDGSIVVQLDPTDGSLDVIYEPQLQFVMPVASEEDASIMDAAANSQTADESAETDSVDSADENELMGWEVEDENKENSNMPNLVITADYKSMGPFALFLPEQQ